MLYFLAAYSALVIPGLIARVAGWSQRLQQKHIQLIVLVHHVYACDRQHVILPPTQDHYSHVLMMKTMRMLTAAALSL